MHEQLLIEADWELLLNGSPEERACFAAVGIRGGDTWLTQAEDVFVHRLRDKVHVSAYRLAEWLAWNWWRLRWEPQSSATDWPMAHRISTIGGGYVWPNITIASDGERIALLARPTTRHANEPLHYIGNALVTVRASVFEGEVDRFISQVLGQLEAEGVQGSNLRKLWDDLLPERADRSLGLQRKFEALLGVDPDEAPESTLDGLIEDSAKFGESSIAEIAADHSPWQYRQPGPALRQSALDLGYDTVPADAVSLAPSLIPEFGDVPAWQCGVTAARALRLSEGLDGAPIDDARLCAMAALPAAALQENHAHPDLSFALDDGPSKGRIVLRSRWHAGRRFETARLLGDRLAAKGHELLYPATRAHTYRQKMQRAFAAELLSPFETVQEKLGGDFSEESQTEVARYFGVSSLTIRTALVNHGLLDRDGLLLQSGA